MSRPARARRLAVALALVGALSAGCGTGGGTDGGPRATSTPAGTSARPAPTTPARATGKASTSKVTAPPTTSTLGPFPPVLRTSPAGVDAGAIHSLADLPAAFQCPAKPAPITLPAASGSPAAVVCQSKLAAGEALYLWYVDSPDARYLALAAALAKARYVRGGATWVAGGTLDAGMGQVGGDVYK